MLRDASCHISQFWLYPIVSFSWKGPKYGPFMAKKWSSNGSSNWLFLNLNQCAQGCSMPNFSVLQSILTDIFNFVTQSGSQSVSQAVRHSVTYPRCRAVPLASSQGHS